MAVGLANHQPAENLPDPELTWTIISSRDTKRRKRKNTPKRKRKKRTKNDIALSYRVELPRPVKKTVVLRRMIRFITSGEELPDNWEITLRWRNSRKSKWREDEFQNAMADSRDAFAKLVLKRLRRDFKFL